MKIAVEGCAHGELEKIYETIQSIEKAENLKVDLLLCCGDFQATRNLSDLQTMAVPRKFQDMCSFYKYYSGEKVAPILTIFIGGNHEASNYLQELPYGGWVAPNIYYMGYAGVVRVNGVRIGGISGIYKGHDFLRGHYEFSPYSESTKRSVYHVRQLEVFRLKQLSGKIDIFMSHDWPRGIYNYGNKAQLIRFKPHFRDEVENNQLGSRPCEDLLKTLKPTLWFAAHLHCKFAAVVQHDDENNDENAASEQITKFLALDKCLPRRRFLQLTDFECVQPTEEKELKLEYDLEWLTILYLTNHLINVKNSTQYMPGPNSGMTEGRYEFTPTNEEMEQVRKKFGKDLRIPQNFCRTVEPYNPNVNESNPQQPKSQINPQSTEFCDKLGIDDPLSLAMLISGHDLSHSRILDDSDLNNSSKLSEDLTSQNSSTCETAQSIEQSPTQHKNNTILNLPKPISERCSISCSSPKLLDLPAENTSNPDELNLDDIPENYTEEDETIKDETENVGKTDILEPNDALNAKPPIKKFKRRNENIYKTEEEE